MSEEQVHPRLKWLSRFSLAVFLFGMLILAFNQSGSLQFGGRNFGVGIEPFKEGFEVQSWRSVTAH